MNQELRAKMDAFIDDALEHRARVIDDFCKVYLASRVDFFRARPERLSRIRLCIQKNAEGTSETMWFEIKRGRASEKQPTP
jgi:hypothetical protein